MRREWLLASLAAVAGFMGGALSNEVGRVFAQDRTRQITAERFLVADANGNKRAELGLDLQGQIHLTLYSEKGRILWSAPMGGVLPLSSTQ